ncbi:MAG TPA: hypothetical protein VGO46_15240 [Gemmatimonadaceae bacterium]|nr:hypothetical protein [Gemmatimonadaceae bacterium]
MTAHDRVAATRRTLGAAVIVRAVLWASAAAAAVLAAAGTTDWLFGAPRTLRALVLPAAIALAIGAAAHALYRGRRVRSLPAVALWLEERVPALRYALVTALDAPLTSPALERDIAAVQWPPVVRRALGNALLPPLLVLAAAATLLFALPAGVRARISEPRAGDTLLRAPIAAAPMRNRLSPLTGEIQPPAYTGEQHVIVDEPSSIEALTGGHIIVRGQGSSSGITASLANLPVTAASLRDSADQWRLDIVVPAKPAALELHDRSYARTIIIAPHPDSLPVVSLTAPTRDTVVRTPKGSLTLGASATDDYGLDAGWFEYIVSSGEGETFTFKSGVIHRTDAGNARSTKLSGSLNLDSLNLKPGDLVHVRAVARDRNNVTGPGIGVSETRTLRIPRASEYDSIAIEGAPPPDVDSSQLSQRMLIILAEKLQARRAKLPRAQVIKESQAIGSDEARLRQHVGEIVFARLGKEQGTEDAGSNNSQTQMTPEQLLAAADAATRTSAGATDFEGDETPVVAVNRPLLEAYNAMWDASRALEVGEPGTALPPMRLALAAIQRARNAERLYLRGKAPVVIVDINKVRLAGKRDDATSSSRLPRAALDSSSERRAQRFDEALNLLATNPSAAVDSLLALRVDALESAPTLAGALAPAIDALRAGHDATDALVRARRIAAGVTLERIDSQWGAAW